MICAGYIMLPLVAVSGGCVRYGFNPDRTGSGLSTADSNIAPDGSLQDGSLGDGPPDDRSPEDGPPRDGPLVDSPPISPDAKKIIDGSADTVPPPPDHQLPDSAPPAPDLQITYKEVYDFSALPANFAIYGQDGWIRQGQGTMHTTVDPFKKHQVLKNLNVPLYNHHTLYSRLNNASFTFKPFSGKETAAIIQFDVLVGYRASFALGRDVTGDGKIQESDGERGPAFGVTTVGTTQHFAIWTTNSISGTPVSQAFPSGNKTGDWIQLQLLVDFTANGGDGAGSLSFKNLTAGDKKFTTLTSLQSVALGLKAQPLSMAPALWNGMHLYMLMLGSAIPAVADLVPHSSAGQ